MFKFKSLTSTNGLDRENLLNARQNNYAWSISELGDYIYVGTGRNILLVILQTYFSGIEVPISIAADEQNNNAEIWRYKKGHSDQPWEKVFTTLESREYGFRYMINFRPFNGNPALFAATAVTSGTMEVFKSVEGVNWKSVSNVKGGGYLLGTSSRAMVTHKGKLYLANIDESGQGPETLLYSSRDPEFYPWKLETPEGTDPTKNPQGGITNMAVFNDHIYVATSTGNGVQVWRTKGSEPEINGWKLVIANGFGSPDNKYTLSIGVFKNHLYVSGTKELPLAWAIPRGCDIVRIDKYDNYEVVVGPGSISNTWSGFYNPFNVYAWQIQEYNGKLLVSTFDDATNIQLILELLLLNRNQLGLPPFIVDILIETYKLAVELLNIFKYPFGFDLYVSENGKDFEPVFLNGLNNRYNYGGRMLFVDSCNDLYIGTANPYQGLEVWKAKESNCYCDEDFEMKEYDYKVIKKEFEKHFAQLEEYMPQIREYLPESIGKYFIKTKKN